VVLKIKFCSLLVYILLLYQLDILLKWSDTHVGMDLSARSLMNLIKILALIFLMSLIPCA